MQKDSLDLALAWFRKGDSDFVNARMCLEVKRSLDTACFHCQQAAEKWLKAYLIAAGIPFPFVHDLTKLLELCAGTNAAFEALAENALALNPYAVTMRYDEEFWPEDEVVSEAIGAAGAIRRVVCDCWPSPDRKPGGEAGD